MTKKNWKDTVLLPKTEFPMRASLAKREPDAIAKWKEAGLYNRLVESRKDGPRFLLHDGPPYANGNLHHGHALNKILKDFIVKYHLKKGYNATYVPGWDCHGLPIEQKVDEELGKKKREMSVTDFRKACRDYADKWVDIQRDEFERLMVFGDWENPYLTMDYSYEATIVRELGKFMKQGYVYRGRKPVHWSWSAVTALADAEVEYAPYTAPSVYVKFDFNEAPVWLKEKADGRKISVVIWTTTPWTLPSNLAIALHPELEYELLELNDDEAVIVAQGRKAITLEECGLDDLPVLASFEGQKLVGTGVGDCPRLVTQHPFIDRTSVLLPADYVTLDQGTGCVHTAPGHGDEDYELGRVFDIGLLAPVNAYGKFTEEVPEYAGTHVFRANPLIVERLVESGHLLNKAGDTYRVERYPHCWRTKKPLIFRATAQWFINVEHENLRGRAHEAIKTTKWIPSWGEKRIGGMMDTRPDWCISRQRAWGVPITAFECESCGGEIIDHRVADFFADIVEKEGADAWFAGEVSDLVPEGYTCPHCDAGPEKFTRVEDILDVWFDSGVSWAAVVRDRLGIDEQIDLYLEGSDQHRGWFQTSLLTSVANADRAPYKAVLTHGFVVDDQGRKYSKSSPNFAPLQRVLDQNGAEVLRLWVAAIDYRADSVFTQDVLRQVSDVYRKVRNTVRFLLGNLVGFDPDAARLQDMELTPIDRWVIRERNTFVEEVSNAFENYQFHMVYRALNDFCNGTLSSVYLDVLKDRLYCERESDPSRQASQAVLYEVARTLIEVSWPILTFMSEEAWELLPRRKGDPEYAALLDWAETIEGGGEPNPQFERWLEVREHVQQEIEARRPKKRGEREEGQLGSSQQAIVTLRVPASELKDFEGSEKALQELFIVSQVHIETGDGNTVEVKVTAADGERCPRCWNYTLDIGSDAQNPELCARCADVVATV